MTVALGNEKATVKGGIYTMLRLPTLDSCSCGEGRCGVGRTEAGWVKWADRQRHLPSVCVVPRHVFKWHRLHFNSDIIHKCGTAAYKSERRKLHCHRKDARGRGTDNGVHRTPKESERKRVREKQNIWLQSAARPGSAAKCKIYELEQLEQPSPRAKG